MFKTLLQHQAIKLAPEEWDLSRFLNILADNQMMNLEAYFFETYRAATAKCHDLRPTPETHI